MGEYVLSMTDVNEQYKEEMEKVMLELKTKTSKFLKKLKDETKNPKVRYGR